MSWPAAIGILVTVGALLSLLSWRLEGLRAYRAFRYGGLALFFILLVPFLAAVSRASGPEMIIIVVACPLVGLAWAAFFAFLVVETISGLTRSALGLDQIRVPPAFSLADAAIARRDYADAERLLRELVETHPDEPEPPRRLGELLLILNRPTEAMACFREAERRDTDPSGKMTARFAVAEILADRLKDPPAAIRCLEEFLEQHADQAQSEYVEERIRRLRARLNPTQR